jgi:hypothetical protein
MEFEKESKQIKNKFYTLYDEDTKFLNLWKNLSHWKIYKDKRFKDSLVVNMCKSFMLYYFKDNKLNCTDETLDEFHKLFKKFYNPKFNSPKSKHFIYIFDENYSDWNVLFKNSNVFYDFIKKNFDYVFEYFNKQK